MSQTKNSSYKKLFSHLAECEDVFEVQVLTRIHDDYEKFHSQDFLQFEKLLSSKDLRCPYCKGKDYIKHGKDRNGTHRYKCKTCGKTFNNANDTLFFSSKINIQAWFAFLECILSGSSTLEACLVAKISPATGSSWMKKLFITLNKYQDNIRLGKLIYVDETYVHEDSSKIYYFDEIGKVKKVKKQPRGISRNKLCIFVATDNNKSIAILEGHGRPKRIKNYEIFKQHMEEKTHLIGDEDTSITYAATKMNMTRTQIKSGTEKAYKELAPIDQLCSRLKFFITKHRGFKKELLQDYLNLFIFIDNEKNREKDLYKITVKLMKMMVLVDKK